MNARTTLAAAAAGTLTIAAVLAGYGQALGQGPSPSQPCAAANAPAGMTTDGAMPMDPADMGAMMGEAMGHMMGSMMTGSGSSSAMGGSWSGGPGHEWDHSSHGLMGGVGGSDPQGACLDLMREMTGMMEMMGGMMSGPSGMDGGNPMGGMAPPSTTEPASPSGPAASPGADTIDHAAHHAAPTASPAA